MTLPGEKRVRLQATTIFVREYEVTVPEGETLEETLEMEQATYAEEPLDTAFDRYVERSLSVNEQTVVEPWEPVVSSSFTLSAEAFDELAEREGREPNEKLVELLRQTRGSVIYTDEKSTRIRELEAELEKRTASLEMLVEAHRVLRKERDELAAAVARIDDKIGTLMMDRENWRAASELQDLLDGTN